MTPSQAILGATAFAVALILFWIYYDARARDAYPTLWVAGILLFAVFAPLLYVVPGTVLALVIYIIVRPKGPLSYCPACGAKHLVWLAECPKCESRLLKDCLRCHAAMPITADRCPECGAPNS